jgi:hypothetical protein
MRQAELGRRLSADFLRDPGRPPDSGTQMGTDGDLDIRRWEGRLAGACLKQYQKAGVLWILCGFQTHRGYGIDRKPQGRTAVPLCLFYLQLWVKDYLSCLRHHQQSKLNIGREFPYQLCYDWLRRYTSLLECDSRSVIKKMP